jgi:tetratricopeptide (TPR) repeat protein
MRPRHPLAGWAIAHPLLGAGDVGGAIAKLEEDLRSRDFIFTHWILAAAWILQGNLNKAHDEYRNGARVFSRWGIKGAGGDMRLGSALGPFLEWFGYPREALDAYERALDVLPGDGPTHRRLADLLRGSRLEGLEGAIDRLIGVLERWKASGRSRPRVLATLALLYARHPLRKDIEGALEEARLADQEARGRDPEVISALADVQALSGDQARAAATLERALRQGDADPSLEVILAARREALRPLVPSFESADALLGERRNTVLIRGDATWRFLRGTRAPSPALEWTGQEFDARDWEEGPGPFGAGLGFRPGTWLHGMPGSYTTMYFRHVFQVADPQLVEDLLLIVRADDGFIAYLNGVEVGRGRAGKPGEAIPPEGSATEGAGTGRPELEPAIRPYGVRLQGSASLRAGTNCLAIQGLNHRKWQDAFYLEAMLLGRVRPAPERSRDALERCRSAAGGGAEGGGGKRGGGTAAAAALAAGGRVRYMEARLLAREGKTAEALEAFRKLVETDAAALEPRLRLAELLRSSGRPAEALQALAAAFIPFPDRRDLWDLRHDIAALDLGLSASEMLGALGWETSQMVREGYGADVVWLLERLAAGETARINCGGERVVGPAGEVWWGDSFHTGGLPERDSLEGPSPGPGGIYRTTRMFPDLGCFTGGYRVPLPRGDYRVTLHFAERLLVRPGKRVFGIRIEGKDVRDRYEPLAAGWAVPSAESFPATVEDGLLDIEFPARSGTPAVCAIEIQAERRP